MVSSALLRAFVQEPSISPNEQSDSLRVHQDISASQFGFCPWYPRRFFGPSFKSLRFLRTNSRIHYVFAKILVHLSLGSVHGILGASSGRCQNPSDCRRYTRRFFGIVHVEHRKTIILFSRRRAHPFDFLSSICGLCGCVLLFSSLFRGKYTMNRLRQFQKSRQIFQGVLFTGVRKFSLQIYRIVFDCFNRVPLALQRWLS